MVVALRVAEPEAADERGAEVVAAVDADMVLGLVGSVFVATALLEADVKVAVASRLACSPVQTGNSGMDNMEMGEAVAGHAGQLLAASTRLVYQAAASEVKLAAISDSVFGMQSPVTTSSAAGMVGVASASETMLFKQAVCCRM